MKKYLCLWLSGVLLASLCGCNNALDVSDDNSGATTTDSMAKVQYQALLENVYQEQSDTYYTLYDVDGDDTQELLVKVGETIVINTARNDWTLPDESDIDWVSFEEEPVHMVDMTFDGFQDVAVCVDNVYGKIFAVLRWDTKLEKLVMMPTTLQNPAVDSQNAIIRTSRSGDQIVSYSMWSYDEEQKDFVRTHSLYFHQNEQATGDDDNMKLVVRENGDEKILYVRGEPYALDKTDPQVAPYYVPGSLWDLDGLQWEAMQWAKKDQYGNYAGYAALLKAEYPNQKIEYALRDLNADGRTDLLVLEEGTTLSVYTKKDGFTHLLVAQDFVSGTSRFLTTGDADYPGIIYFCVGGGKDRYYYLSLDNVENGEFVKIPLWTDNYSLYEEGEEGRITELSDDKKLIELSREAYQNNCDLVFSQFGGSASDIALNQKHRQAVQAYSSDSKNHRDVDALQPETMDIIQIDGKYYQTYVSGKVDMRYIWLSQYEADIGIASWDWVPIGTEDDYSLSNIGKIDVGQRGDEPDDSIWYSEEVGVRGRIWLGMTEQELYDVLNEHNIEITFANFTYERDAYGAEYLPSSDFYYKRLYTKGHQYFYFDEDNRLAEIHYSDQLRPSMDPVNEEFEAQHGVRRGGTYEEMIAAYGEPDQVIEQEGNQSCVYHLENGDYLHFVYQGLSLPILFITYSRHPIPYSIW